MIRTASTLPRPFFERAGKIGKNNPKESEIKADNEARHCPSKGRTRNRTVDIALVEGVPDPEIRKLKKDEISSKIQESIDAFGKKPGLFRPIVRRAKEILLDLLQKWKVPSKPKLSIDLVVFRKMEGIKAELDKQVQAIHHSEKVELPDFERTLEGLKGMFKARERKQIEVKVDATKKKASKMKSDLKRMVSRHGYKNVQSFMNIYNQSRDAVLQYQIELKNWQEKSGQKPPSKESVREQLRRYEHEVRKQKSVKMNRAKQQREISHYER